MASLHHVQNVHDKRTNHQGDELIPVAGTLTALKSKAWEVLTHADGVTRYLPYSTCQAEGNPNTSEPCTILAPLYCLERSKGGFPAWVHDHKLPVTYTRFDTLKAQQGQAIATNWFDFCQFIRTVPTYPTKDSQPLIKLATFEGDSRAKGNGLDKVHGVELDYDDGLVTPEQAAALLRDAGIKAIVCSTYTSTHDKPKWRAFLPFAKPCPAQYRASFVAALDAVLGHIIAPESYREKQIFFIGQNPDADYQAIQCDGEPLDTLQAMKDEARHYWEQQQRETRAQAKSAAESLKRAKVEKLSEGQISVIDSFNDAYDLYTILSSHGYSKKGTRYKAPSSQSGMPGINVLRCDDGKERIYSHHSSDPLNVSRALDTFDVFALLEHGGDVYKAIQAAAHLVYTGSITLHHHNREVWRKQQAQGKASQLSQGVKS